MGHASERTVVVGVDGSGDSLAAVDVAAAEADQRGLPLLLLSAHPDAGHAGPGTALTAVLRRVCTTWQGVAVSARQVGAEPAEALINASRTAALVVVGQCGRGGEQRPGSVCSQLAAHAFSPTLIVPAGATQVPADRPVLLGLGMSPTDEPTIGFAFEEAALRRVPLLAVHVWSGIPASAQRTVSPYAYDLYEAQSAADRMLAEALTGWADKHPDVKVDRMPLYDVNPARTLLDASALAGLAVVGARRHGRRSSQLLGTVTRALIQHATCPVAVIRPTA
jgi:nucleotide-binding universal stress UspA family protein